MKTAIRYAPAVLALAVLAAPMGARADEDDATSQDELAKAIEGAKVPLERGVSAAAAREGSPISAKYELDEGRLQLSVYTMKGGRFSEVTVDQGTGKVTKTEAITSGEDLAAAKEQQEVMAKARRSLQEVTASATQHNPGYRAVSVTPRLEDGRPVAKVMLLKGTDWKTVSLPLDAAR